ncbi:MAG TPA: hypothetical protein VGW38_27980 [Chloroflexota bacterium]|nr:hypothetical protein [Chloroflexota bacterium]
MELRSTTGDAVRLSPTSYQFPAGDNDWDLNWLVMEGRVVSGQKEWIFRDPCLTTWEARGLGEWLGGVANGTTFVVAQPPGLEDEPALTFTEPNLGFSLRDRDQQRALLWVHLSLESLPPEAQATDEYQHVVEFDMPTSDIASAAGQWQEELTAFPERRP